MVLENWVRSSFSKRLFRRPPVSGVRTVGESRSRGVRAARTFSLLFAGGRIAKEGGGGFLQPVVAHQSRAENADLNFIAVREGVAGHKVLGFQTLRRIEFLFGRGVFLEIRRSTPRLGLLERDMRPSMRRDDTPFSPRGALSNTTRNKHPSSLLPQGEKDACHHLISSGLRQRAARRWKGRPSQGVKDACRGLL